MPSPAFCLPFFKSTSGKCGLLPRSASLHFSLMLRSFWQFCGRAFLVLAYISSTFSIFCSSFSFASSVSKSFRILSYFLILQCTFSCFSFAYPLFMFLLCFFCAKANTTGLRLQNHVATLRSCVDLFEVSRKKVTCSSKSLIAQKVV